jgi:Tfp pilus assembly PilM family ATPase
MAIELKMKNITLNVDKKTVSLDLQKDKMVICGVKKLDTDKPELSFIEIIEIQNYLDIAHLSKCLSLVVKRLKLQDWPWVINVNRPDYQIQMMEAPNINEDEIPAAIRLKVKDFVNEPLESLLIESLLLPLKAFSGNRRMAFAVIIDRKRVMALTEMMMMLGLKLRAIDIAEQAQRNLLSIGSHSERAAFLSMGEESSTILMCYEHQVCLQRRLEVGANNFINHSENDNDGLLQTPSRMKMDAMAIEIQRSFDYFESQLNLGSVGELKIAQNGEDNHELKTVLQESFGARVSFFKLSDHLDCTAIKSKTLLNNRIAIGAALRNYDRTNGEVI